jgi:hypothetical protein
LAGPSFRLLPPLLGSAWTLRRRDGVASRPAVLTLSPNARDFRVAYAEAAWEIEALDLFTLLTCVAARSSASLSAFAAGGAAGGSGPA